MANPQVMHRHKKTARLDGGRLIGKQLVAGYLKLAFRVPQVGKSVSTAPQSAI